MPMRQRLPLRSLGGRAGQRERLSGGLFGARGGTRVPAMLVAHRKRGLNLELPGLYGRGLPRGKDGNGFITICDKSP